MNINFTCPLNSSLPTCPKPCSFCDAVFEQDFMSRKGPCGGSKGIKHVLQMKKKKLEGFIYTSLESTASFSFLYKSIFFAKKSRPTLSGPQCLAALNEKHFFPCVSLTDHKSERLHFRPITDYNIARINRCHVMVALAKY